MLRSFRMGNQNEKLLIGSKWQNLVLLLSGTYSYTSVASNIKAESHLFLLSLVEKTNILI